MASATGKKLEKLYAGLGPKEIRRMMAKLSREHKPDEMNRLGRAISMDHAALYNRGLKLLRVANGTALDWIGLTKLGMERDRLRFQTFVREAAMLSHLRYQFNQLWKIIPYPVTESEYRAIVKRDRAELWTLDEYLERLIEWGHPKLNPTVAAYLERETEDNAGDEDEETSWQSTYAGVRAIIDDAIKKGELPKPKRRDGEPALPLGVLADWGEGTTEETYTLSYPGAHVPMLALLDGDLNTEWDIRPDSEADAVKERRSAILKNFPILPGHPEEPKASIPNLDPPLTKKELEQSEALARSLSEESESWAALAELAYDAALSHAEHRSMFEGIREALEIVQRDDFYGEDPLFPEIRAQLDAAQEEADRFPDLWEQANSIGLGLYPSLWRLQGLEEPAWEWEGDKLKPRPVAPMPTKEPQTEAMRKLILDWGE